MKITTDATFADDISNGVTLVDFWAPWCGPCRMMLPVLEELSEEMIGVNICKMNVEENPLSAAHFQIMSIPALLIFKDGQLIESKMGRQDKEDLRNWINSHK